MKSLFQNPYFLPVCILSILFLVSACDDDEEPEIQYPATGFYGDNLLMKGKTEYDKQENSLHAKVPEGQKLKIIITGITTEFPVGVWYIESGSSNNWAISHYDMSNNSQIFESIDGGLTCDIRMQFDNGTFQIEYYENDATTPTATKIIEVNY
jgi:hypothetical protein